MTFSFARFKDGSTHAQAVGTKHDSWKKYRGDGPANDFRVMSVLKAGVAIIGVAFGLGSPFALLTVPVAIGTGLTYLAAAFKQGSIRSQTEQLRDPKQIYNGKKFFKNAARYLVQPF